jgi:hypothetical protein
VSCHREPGQHGDPLVQIDITLTLPRQIVWLLTGVAIGNPYAFGSLIEKIGHVLRALAAY